MRRLCVQCQVVLATLAQTLVLAEFSVQTI